MTKLEYDECIIHPYGLIRNPINRKILLSAYKERGLSSFPVILNGEKVTVLNIQDEFAYQKGEQVGGIREYNPDFHPINGPRDARWRFTEIEYKLNILDKQEEFYQLFQCIELSGFSINRQPQEFRSVETMFYPCPDSYFSLLRWENEQTYNAVKIKKALAESPILSRDTLIVDYSPQQMAQILQSFKTDYDGFVHNSSTFFKKKQRYVAVDEEYGYVFGVSYNISDFEGQAFCQIELEYWSKIVSQNELDTSTQADDISYRLDSHRKLIDSMCRYLADNGIRYNNVQLQKKTWLQKIAESRMK